MIMNFEAAYLGFNMRTGKNGNFCIINFCDDDGNSHGFLLKDTENLNKLQQFDRYNVTVDYSNYQNKSYFNIKSIVKA